MTDQEKVTYIFAVLDRSKVTIKHMAAMSSTTRVTLHKWKHSPSGFDSVRVAVAHGVARRLGKACDEGRLPLKPGIKANEKLPTLVAIVNGTKL